MPSKETLEFIAEHSKIANNKPLHEYTGPEVLEVITTADDETCILCYDTLFGNGMTDTDIRMCFLLVPEYWERVILARIGRRLKNATDQ